MSTLLTLNSHAFSVGPFTSSAVPAPDGGGVEASLSCAGWPSGRGGDNALVSVILMTSQDGGATFTNTFASVITGAVAGQMNDPHGAAMPTVQIRATWPPGTTHVKVSADVFVAFVSTVIITSVPTF